VAIFRHGIGYDSVDVAAATELGIVVATVPGRVEQEAVAEHTVGLMLSLIRQLRPACRAVHEGAWHERSRFIGFELRAKRVGLIGIGNIGTRVAEILRQGFRTEVVAYDPKLAHAEIRARYATPVTLDELFETSEVISLHCSLQSDNKAMLAASEFTRMKEGAILINTARGELIDYSALMGALESGRLGGFAADVVAERNREIAREMLRFPNVIIVPHLGSYTSESLEGMGEFMVQGVEEVVLRQKIPRIALNGSLLGKLRG
jgi:phosphoglycerate dehydrogenase-like enzyme